MVFELLFNAILSAVRAGSLAPVINHQLGKPGLPLARQSIYLGGVLNVGATLRHSGPPFGGADRFRSCFFSLLHVPVTESASQSTTPKDHHDSAASSERGYSVNRGDLVTVTPPAKGHRHTAAKVTLGSWRDGKSFFESPFCFWAGFVEQPLCPQQALTGAVKPSLGGQYSARF